MLATLETLLNRLEEGRAERDQPPCRGHLPAHVDDAHVGHRTVQDALRELHALVTARSRRWPPTRAMAWPIRGRRARAPSGRAPPPRRGRDSAASPPACTRTRALRRPRSAPSRSSGAKIADRVPMTMSTSPRRMRCHWSCRSPSERPLCCTATRVPNSRAELPDERRRQRDLRHEHKHAAAPVHHVLRKAQVHLCLAAAGHAVEQGHAELPLIGSLTQASERCDLLVRELSGRWRRRSKAPVAAATRFASERIALDDLLAHPHRAGLGEAAHRRPADARLSELAERYTARPGRDELQRLLLTFAAHGGPGGRARRELHDVAACETARPRPGARPAAWR